MSHRITPSVHSAFDPVFADQVVVWTESTRWWSRTVRWFPELAGSFQVRAFTSVCVTEAARSVTSSLVPTLGPACKVTLAPRWGVQSCFPSLLGELAGGAGANDSSGVRTRSRASVCASSPGVPSPGRRGTLSSCAAFLGGGVLGPFP